MKKINKKIIIFCILAFLSLICSLSTICAANNTINAGDYGGIRQGIVDTGNGETLFLKPGVYNQTNNDTGIFISKNLTIHGEGSSDSVIVDGLGNNRIFTVNNDYTVTFINIRFVNGVSYVHGGAVYGNAATLSFINCSFDNNRELGTGTPGGGLGGAIYNNYNLTVIGSNFTNNYAQNSGGAIASNAALFVDNCLFINNFARNHAGAIDIQGHNSLIISSKFINNRVNDTGGAIWSHRDNLTILNSYFEGNSARNSGGAITYSGANLNVESSTFLKNSATPSYGAGGAMELLGKNGSIFNSTFINNSAVWYGGAIHVTDSLQIKNSYFIGNTAGRNGGAVSNNQRGDPIIIYGSVFVNNTLTAMNDPTYGDYAYGGAIYIISHNSIITNSNFTNNSLKNSTSIAVFAGAITIYGNNMLVEYCEFIANSGTYSSGAININTGNNNTISNCNFINNSASRGGAILNSGTNSKIINSTFINNTAFVYGGGIYNSGSLTVSGNTMIGNSAGTLANFIYNTGTMGILNLTYLDNSTKKVRNNTQIILYATLTDDMDNPVTGGDISFFVDGEYIGNVTSLEGFASINYTPIVLGVVPVDGSYSAYGSYPIDIYQGQLEVYEKNVTNSTINILKNIKVGQSINITGIAKDENGNPIANTSFNLSVNGFNYTVTTDNNGNWVLVYIPNQTGNLVVSVNWQGNSTHFGFVNNSVSFVERIATNSSIIIPSNNSVNKTILIQGVITDEFQNVLANVQINVTIDGQSYSITADNNGLWALNYTPTHLGTITVLVTFSGNYSHLEFINSTFFSVINYNANSNNTYNSNNSTENDYNTAKINNSPGKEKSAVINKNPLNENSVTKNKNPNGDEFSFDKNKNSSDDNINSEKNKYSHDKDNIQNKFKYTHSMKKTGLPLAILLLTLSLCIISMRKLK